MPLIDYDPVTRGSTSTSSLDRLLKLHITKTCLCNIQRFFYVVKNENFVRKKKDIFLIFAQNIDCGYTLEPPREGGSNEYPQHLFWNKNKKSRYTPEYPSFFYIKVGFKGYMLHRHVFLMKNGQPELF